MSEELENLKPWFDSINEDDEDKLNELNQLFKSHFIDNSVFLNFLKNYITQNFTGLSKFHI